MRCFSPKPKTADCSHPYLCYHCKEPHNSLLHINESNPSSKSNSNPSTSRASNTTVVSHHGTHRNQPQTLLATVLVNIRASIGQVLRFRALVDPGSQISLITRSASNLLKLKMRKCNTFIRGMGGASAGASSHIIDCVANSIHNKEHQVKIEAFIMTHVRKLDGRYSVDLPFNTDDKLPPQFGNSRSQTYMRLVQLEREFMNEYIRLGHMRPISTPSISSSYLPHHAIIKPSSSSTKLRVVFDASAKDSNCKSLNQTFHVGPTIQQDLLSILLRWRKHTFAVTSDVEKMYRQFQINMHHLPFQRILWRDADDEIKDYELTTVTYGTACAPYLAIRTMHQLANDEKHNHPSASERTL